MKQCEIWSTNLNPGKGSDQQGIRPVVIISGNLMNQYLQVVIVCPLTTKIKNYKGNIVLEPNDENGLSEISEIMVFHIRPVLKDRLVKKVGRVSEEQLKQLKVSLDDILRY